MTKKRQRRSADFKFRLALEATKEQKTLSQLASEYEVHPTQITQWKKQLLDGGSCKLQRRNGSWPLLVK
jgi:transposase-like protein